MNASLLVTLLEIYDKVVRHVPQIEIAKKVLNVLASQGATAPHRGLTVSDLAREVKVCRQSIMRTLSKLSEIGIVSRAESRRGSYIVYVYYINMEGVVKIARMLLHVLENYMNMLEEFCKL